MAFAEKLNAFLGQLSMLQSDINEPSEPVMSEPAEADEAPAPSKMLQEWQRVRPWVVEAIANGPGFETIEAVEQKISEGFYVFWAGPDSVVITRLDVWSGKKIFCIVYAGGNVPAAIETGEADLLRMATLMDCDAVLVETPGEWAPLLHDKGFVPAWVAMMKPLRAPADAVTA
jgi:hypothetical protein